MIHEVQEGAWKFDGVKRNHKWVSGEEIAAYAASSER
jgi:hypothetical protein